MKTWLLFAVIFIVVIILDYYLVKKWALYKKLAEENRQEEHPSKNLELLKKSFLGDQFLDSNRTCRGSCLWSPSKS